MVHRFVSLRARAAVLTTPTWRLGDTLPVLPLRNSVAFPLIAAPILIGQERSIQLIEEAQRGNQLIGVIAQRNEHAVPAGPDDIFRVGTLATIREVVQLSAKDRTVQVVLSGRERFRVLDFVRTEPYLVCRFATATEIEETGGNAEVLIGTVKTLFRQLVELAIELPDELADALPHLTSGRHLAYIIATTMSLSVEVKHPLLELASVSAKLDQLVGILKHEIAVRRVVHEVTAETAAEMSKAQREAILRMQMGTIQKELGETEPEQAEANDLRARLSALSLSDEARRETDRELDRLERIPSASPEHGIIRTYLDWIAKLPWAKATGGAIDERRARVVLDEDHFDLDKVKERIVEYLAVKALRSERAQELGTTPEARVEPILCFVGPPGVGKTSLGQSIARAMGRKFTRLSLGGVHDEAEIRGHRRTYIGALPGRVIQGIVRAEALDPVFMLDEVDKLDRGFHGDPSAALLEVLDPAQNHAFVDNYLGVAFDVSQVLFICTANSTDTIPPALLDRLEVLTLAGYTDEEKLHIAMRYLVPRQRFAHGLRDSEVTFDETTLPRIIREYTREAGVRNLEREIATILRKVAQRIHSGVSGPIRVTPAELHEFLGPQRFFDEVVERIDRPGVATGLAWTPAGGDILFVEASLMPSERMNLVLTGMLGDVMRESAQAAMSWLRSNTAVLGIAADAFARKEIHVHVPAGAIPKDGPSAGLTIVSALASHALGRPVRSDVATTGEITLRGKVLPVGGIKEKVLAAHRAGIKVIVLPRRNEGDLEDVPDEVRRACELVLVDSIGEALAVTLGVPLTGAPEPDGSRLHAIEHRPAH
ncbi:MAG: endopeptidase La [Kofleriaceae bacterium]